MAEATETTSQEIEKELKKTDFGEFVYQNRNLIIGLVIAIVVGTSGYLFWKKQQTKESLNLAGEVFEFQAANKEALFSKKITAEEYLGKFKELPQNVQTHEMMVQESFEVSKWLKENDHSVEAADIYSIVSQGLNKKDLLYPLLALQYSALLEDLSEIDKAIEVVLPIAKDNKAIFHKRFTFRLGRLYQTKGSQNEASKQFQYLLSEFPQSEEAKLAKLYLLKRSGE